MAFELIGRWRRGLAYDMHTLGSVYLGVDDQGYKHWDNTRSEMGELVYQLKYQADISCISKIIKKLNAVKGVEKMDYLVPVPSTNNSRRVQPVMEITHALGRHRNVRVLDKFLCKYPGGAELKNENDPDKRECLLRESLYIEGFGNLKNKNILIVDDVYRSGVTLTVATDLIYQHTQVGNVFVLTMTKTRSKR